ncbi:DUF4349 domain-containing protein [Tenggerimyces flavus]|uniref:DUF4349 domain-containing protein n=1 Tax=Tenggerimyces flavus TaxID=1708749 RepID=A0ABV7YQ51_9ACTN|nr:DUF4349 domain-containing protein [Tenggerimyces flavus]MBM7787762.1 hypothetical protein [Tenggerimyces flavus]
MRRTRPFLIAVASGVAALALAAGCSGAATSANGSGGSEARSLSGQSDQSGGAAQKAPQAVPGAPQDNAAPQPEAKQQQNRPRLQIRERAIIRTGTIHIEVANVQAANDKIAVLVGAEGYVSSEQSATDGDGKVTSIQLVLRVPVDDFNRVRVGVRKLGAKVLDDKHNAQDVTDEVVDVESRIASQKKSIERLRTLIGQAKTVGEVVQVETELTSREAELESLQARQSALASQSSLSTLSVVLSAPPPKDEEPVDPDDNLGFLQGLSDGWNAFVGTVQVVLTVVGALIPFVVALALLGAIPAWFYLRARRRRFASQSAL